MKRARSHPVALLALTALLLSGALPALPHGHPSPTSAEASSGETGCPCPDDHLGRRDNPAYERCPICSLTRLAAHGPVASSDLRSAVLVVTPLPPVTELLPERFLTSAPEARGPPLS